MVAFVLLLRLFPRHSLKISSECLLLPAVDSPLALVFEMVFTLLGRLYSYDPRVLIDTFLMSSFFAFEFDGRVWALIDSS